MNLQVTKKTVPEGAYGVDKTADILLTHALLALVEKLEQLCHYSEEIICIAGAKGSGKTTCAEVFISRQSLNFNICYLVAEVEWDVKMLLRRLAQGLGLNWDLQNIENKPLMGRNKDYIPSPHPFVLILDNAEVLSNEVLAALLQIKGLHIVLIGDAKVAEQIGFLQGGQVLTIEPFAQDEVKQFIMKRKKIDFVSNKLLKEIYQQSQGRPGKILELLQKKPNNWLKLVPAMLLGLGVVVSVSLVLNYKPELMAASSAITDTIKQNDAQGLLKQQQVDYPVQVLSIPLPETQPKSEINPVTTNLAMALSPQPLAQAKQLPPPPPQHDNLPAQNNERLPEGADRLPPPPPPGAQRDKKVLPKRTKSALKKELQSKFTIQLAALHDKKQANNFISKNQLKTAIVVPKMRAGKTVYLVLYGNFATRAEASAAITKLPVGIKILNPWVKANGNL